MKTLSVLFIALTLGSAAHAKEVRTYRASCEVLPLNDDLPPFTPPKPEAIFDVAVALEAPTQKVYSNEIGDYLIAYRRWLDSYQLDLFFHDGKTGKNAFAETTAKALPENITLVNGAGSDYRAFSCTLKE